MNTNMIHRHDVIIGGGLTDLRVSVTVLDVGRYVAFPDRYHATDKRSKS